MSEPEGVVAVIVGNPALSSILTGMLACDPRLRVRAFESEDALCAYRRIAPVHLVICDLDAESIPFAGLLARLRRESGPGFEAIALTRAVAPDTRRRIRAAGVAELIVKPMSPRHLHQRVLNRLARRRSPAPEPRFGGNVVELFPLRPPQPAL